MSKVLLVIDLQNDYFEGGKFPLWNTEKTLDNILKAIEKAKENNTSVVHIQHIADPSLGLAPFFNKGTEGAEIHPQILKAAPEGRVVVKSYADGFYETDLEKVLTELNIAELLVCGMMTQNCVTHTAISKSAEKYKVKVLADCCTTVNEAIHMIGLHAITTRVDVVEYEEAMK